MSSTQLLQNEKWQSCIDACMRCAESCEYCATCDLQEENVKMMINCVQTNRACASVCWTSAQLMSIDSEFAKKFCKLCADIRDTCAKECERHTDMDHCQLCAQTCRKCADECRRMSGAT